jgi:signal transduction histidine kinase
LMSLTRKLVLAFLAVSLVGALMAVGLARWMTVEEFNRLVIEQVQEDFIERSKAYYILNGSWQGVALHFRQSPRPPFQQQPKSSDNKPSPQPTFAFTLVDQDGRVVVPGGPYRLRDQVTEEIIATGDPIQVNGETVGTVIASGKPPELAPQELRYLERTNRALILAAGGAALVALIMGIFIARSLTSPLRALTDATRNLGEGSFGQQVSIHSKDEIGELVSAFNQMSAELESLIVQRQQMTADIAHDLRTPLTVIGGYIESMQDGTLAATPERLDTIYLEVQHLQRLVEDLRTLSLAEAGQLSLNLTSIPSQDLLEQVEAAYRLSAQQKGIELMLEESQDFPDVRVDPDRMMQVLSNLVRNALRHTPKGGVIRLNASQSNSWIKISIIDTGEGISSEELPHIFDRFYRGDQARQADEGESGLGLAIAKSIVEMHGGKLLAYSDGKGKGSQFTIQLSLKTGAA